MKINLLNLKAFGVFTDYKITFPDSNSFHIICGANEAGKSTVLRAIIDLLYGIPHMSRDSFLHDKLLIEGNISSHDGSQFIFGRRKGRKNTLIDPISGNPLSDSSLQKFLNNIDRDAFSAMFGMDHSRLRIGGESILKGGGVVGETLFEAAAGISLIRNLLSRLNGEMDELYKRSGSRPMINEKIREYREARQTLNELSMTASSWHELESSYEKEKEKLEQLNETIKEYKKQMASFERKKRVLPLLSERKNYMEEIEGLNDVPVLRENFSEERVNLIAALEKAVTAKNRILKDIEERELRAGAITINERILEKLPVITELHGKIDAYRNCNNDLPEITDESKSIEQEASAILKEVNPSLKSLDETDKLLLSFEQKEEIKRLITEDKKMQNDLNLVAERIKTFSRSLEKNCKERNKLGELRDADRLVRTLDLARKKGNLEDILSDNRLKAKAAEKALMRNLDALGLWNGTAEDFGKLKLPLSETVKLFNERYINVDAQKKETDDKIKDYEDNIATKKEELESIEASGEVPTAEQLDAERGRRDRGWGLVKRAWLQNERNSKEEKEFDPDKPLDTAYENSVLKADNIADIRYKDAKNVATKEALLRDINKYEQKLEEISKSRDALEMKYGHLDNEWVRIWEDAGITPLSPREMLSWLECCKEIKEQINDIEIRMKEADKLGEDAYKHRYEINNALKELGEDADKEETLEQLVSRALDIARSIETNANNIKHIEEAREQIESDLNQAQMEKKQIEESIGEWKNNWTKSMEWLGLTKDTDTAIAEALLRKIDNLFSQKRELNKINRRIKAMQDYREDFEAKAEEILKDVAPDLKDLPFHLAVLKLHELAEKTKNEKTTLEEINGGIKKLQKELKDATEAHDDAERKIAELLKEAGCWDLAELEKVEQRYKRVCELKDKISETEDRLIKAGDDLTLNEIQREAKDADLDTVMAEIQDLEHRLEQTDIERSELEQEFGAIKKEYNQKIEGSSTAAVEVAGRAQSLLAELSTKTERYVKLRIASFVLRRGIDRYRQENQDPILRKASEIFAKLTAGSFSELIVDYDDKDNAVIVGIRPSGEAVFVYGMSDGTQDQLYLSLRLAFLHKFCEETEPMPLILDDILINFDDQRSGDTLKVLADVSNKTQVLFFTHHNALVDLARAHIPGELLHIHELTG